MVLMQNKSHLTHIFITVFLYLLGFGIMIPIMPMMGRSYGASSLEVGLLMSTYSLMQFILIPLWGRLSDRYGRRRILLFCLTGEALSYLIFAFSTQLTGLFVARFLGGFFAATLSTASASVSDMTPQNQRSQGMALMGAAFSLGFVFGPALGGIFVLLGESIFPDKGSLFGMRFASIVVCLLMTATFVFAWFKLKETSHLSRLNQKKNKQPKAPRRLSLIGRFLRVPILGPLMTAFFFHTFALAIMESTLILLVADKFNWGITQISFGFVYIGLLSAFSQGVFVRRFLPFYGEKIFLFFGLLLQVIGYCFITFSDSVSFLALAMTIFSLGSSFTSPSLMGSISLLSPQQEQGEALGTTQSLGSLGRILGPALGGALYTRFSWDWPFLSSASIAFLALVMIFLIRKKLPSSALNSL
jgi:MFS transporter, DHA1 family, tetracycline resistance protein